MFPLSVNFGFGEIAEGETPPTSKVTLPLPVFPVTKLQGESNDRFLARIELGTENAVGSYVRVEHDACIMVLSNGGRLNQVFEKAGVPYSPRLDPSTEASAEAVRKGKVDGGVRPVGKQVKIGGKKKVGKTVVAPKVPAVKPATTPKVAAAKASALATSKAIADAAPSKGAAMGQNRAGVLKLSTGAKRPASMELSLVGTAKRANAAKASSSTHGAGDEWVEDCSMLGVASSTSSSSTSSD
jgi:hypothetical protein